MCFNSVKVNRYRYKCNLLLRCVVLGVFKKRLVLARSHIIIVSETIQYKAKAKVLANILMIPLTRGNLFRYLILSSEMVPGGSDHIDLRRAPYLCQSFRSSVQGISALHMYETYRIVRALSVELFVMFIDQCRQSDSIRATSEMPPLAKMALVYHEPVLGMTNIPDPDSL